MVDYKQILRLRAEGVSQRGIAEVLGCSRNTVAAVFAAANAAGVGFGEVADLGDRRLQFSWILRLVRAVVPGLGEPLFRCGVSHCGAAG